MLVCFNKFCLLSDRKLGQNVVAPWKALWEHKCAKTAHEELCCESDLSVFSIFRDLRSTDLLSEWRICPTVSFLFFFFNKSLDEAKKESWKLWQTFSMHICFYTFIIVPQFIHIKCHMIKMVSTKWLLLCETTYINGLKAFILKKPTLLA